MSLKLSNFAGSKGGSSGGHIAANNLFSNANLKVLDLISEGQIGGLVDGAKSIFFDDVPLQNESGTYNFDNINVDWVNGAPDQRILEGFNDVTTPQNVGAEVKYGLPITQAIDSSEADKVSIIVSLPQLYGSDKKGNIFETSVSFRFEIAVNNTGEWSKLGDFTISGKQNSQYQRSYTFDLPQKDSSGVKANKWLIKMTRLSEDSHERYMARTVFDSMYIINTSKLNYPYCALVGIRVNAENLTSVPTRLSRFRPTTIPRQIPTRALGMARSRWMCRQTRLGFFTPCLPTNVGGWANSSSRTKSTRRNSTKSGAIVTKRLMMATARKKSVLPSTLKFRNAPTLIR